MQHLPGHKRHLRHIRSAQLSLSLSIQRSNRGTLFAFQPLEISKEAFSWVVVRCHSEGGFVVWRLLGPRRIFEFAVQLQRWPLARNLAAITGAPARRGAVAGLASRVALSTLLSFACAPIQLCVGCDREAQPLCGAAPPAPSGILLVRAKLFFFFSLQPVFFFFTFLFHRPGDGKAPREQPPLLLGTSSLSSWS